MDHMSPFGGFPEVFIRRRRPGQFNSVDEPHDVPDHRLRKCSQKHSVRMIRRQYEAVRVVGIDDLDARPFTGGPFHQARI
jgi:hypothetical protein